MLTIGWQERVSLPLLGLTGLKAKIDTGARTSALHATGMTPFERDGAPWVRFHSRFDDDAPDIEHECPVHDQREITNTSGVPEMRYVVRTRFAIAKRAWRIDLSLADRTGMTFRMIVGRTALKNRSVLVDPGGKNLTHGPKTDLADRGHRKRRSP